MEKGQLRSTVETLGGKLESHHPQQHPEGNESGGQSKGQEVLPDIKGISTFQEMYDILHNTIYPVNVSTTPAIWANWLATPQMDEDNRITQVSAQEINEAIQTSQSDSAVGIDNVRYRMVKAG